MLLCRLYFTALTPSLLPSSSLGNIISEIYDCKKSINLGFMVTSAKLLKKNRFLRLRGNGAIQTTTAILKR